MERIRAEAEQKRNFDQRRLHEEQQTQQQLQQQAESVGRRNKYRHISFRIQK